MKTNAERGDLFATLAGPTIWAVGFSVLYGIQGAGCQLGWETLAAGPLDLLHALLLLAWALHLAAGVWVLRWTLRRGYLPPERRVLRFAAPAMAVTGLFATAWTGLPVVFTSACLT